MTDERSVHGQADVVHLSDEAAAVEVLERAVAGLWDVVAGSRGCGGLGGRTTA
jgi:hypothetical protein